MSSKPKIIEAEASIRGEYTYSKSWKIALIITALGFMAVGVILLYMGYVEPIDGHMDFSSVLIGLSLLAFGAVTVALSHCEKATIERDRISSTNLFGTRTLLLNEIRGLRMGNYAIKFIPKNNKLKAVSFATYYRDYGAIALWAYENFNDLDEEDDLVKLNQIIRNPRYGRNVQERMDTVNHYKKRLRPLNVLSFIVIAAVIFFPNVFYRLQLAACALLPLVAVAIHVGSKGLVAYDDDDKSRLPSVGLTLILPLCGLLLSAIKFNNIMDYTPLWLPFGLLTGLLVTIVVIAERHITHSKASMLITLTISLFLCSAYAYSTIKIGNDLFDKSSPITYRTKILDKWESGGRSRSLNIRLAPWEQGMDMEDVTISRRQYQRVSIGDSVSVDCYNGALGIPYFYVVIP